MKKDEAAVDHIIVLEDISNELCDEEENIRTPSPNRSMNDEMVKFVSCSMTDQKQSIEQNYENIQSDILVLLDFNGSYV